MNHRFVLHNHTVALLSLQTCANMVFRCMAELFDCISVTTDSLSLFRSVPQDVGDRETSHDCGVCSTSSLPSVLTDRTLEKPLPLPFPLPNNYPPLVTVALQNKQLNGKAMVKFITTIAIAIFHHKNYPTKEEKEHVARQCVKAFPFLEANCGSGHVSTNPHSLQVHLIAY